MDVLPVYVLIAFVVGLLIYVLYKRYRTYNVTDPSQVDWSSMPSGSVALSSESRQVTPKGAIVFSRNGVTPTVLSLVDAGLDRAFADAVLSGYTLRLDHTFYDIYIPKYDCVPSPLGRVPSFLIRADEYDGTDYDYYNPKGTGVKDGIGVIYAAEMVLSLGTQGSTFERGQMVCCADESVIENATRYGAEHIIVANNDPEYFNKTWFHDVVGHPILPKIELPAVEGLAETSISSIKLIHTVK